MATIGVYDWDFMNYRNVIPNLECAKIYTYFHNRREIAVLAPRLEPTLYTKFYIRKEYNDGVYPKSLFLPNCEYGGRAFTPNKYSPLPPEIERTIPNMHLFDRYIDRFGTKAHEIQQIKRILNCAHIRLSTDEETPKSMAQLQRILSTGRYTGIIFHDYDLGRSKASYDVVYELSQTRLFKTKKGINPYPIGNKFPIQVYTSDSLKKWLRVVSMRNLFSLQYNGLMEDGTLSYLCTKNARLARQMYYKIDESWYDENHFLQRTLPKIFMQVLFLRRQGIKILLRYSEDKIITKELQDFIDLLNCWLSFSWQENFMRGTQSLYDFCRDTKKLRYKNWAFMSVTVSTDDARNSFQYIRENNYELFKKLYELDSIIYEGGKLVDEWESDSRRNR